MRLTQSNPPYVVLVMVGLLFAACANQMEPARQALDGVNSAVSAAAPDASKYLPDAFTALQSKVTDLQASFDKKDYREVLLRAPAVLADAISLAQAAAARKAEAIKALTGQWTDITSYLPKLLETVKKRVDALAKSKHSPKGMDLSAAKSALADASSSWDMAQTAFGAGHIEEAVNAGKSAKTKAETAAAAINLKLPPEKAAAK